MELKQFHASVFLFLSNFLLSHQSCHEATDPTVVYASKFPTFQFSNEKAKNQSIEQGRYIQENVFILDADYHAFTNRFFVTTPLFGTGIPASLSILNVTTGLLKPFPSFPTYMNSTSISCNSLYSVVRTFIDDCGRLWVMDSGRNETVTPTYLHCPPKLVIYDLKNKDREILRYEFPYGVYTERSFFINVIVESHKGDCSGSYAYCADTGDYGLVVYDYAAKNSWRIEHKYFYPFPYEMTVSLNYHLMPFDSTEGIFGVTLGPKAESYRKLYYHSYTSVRETWAPISVLKNKTIANNAQVTRKAYVLSPGRRRSQSTVEVMTDDGILIYALVKTNQLACWNSRTSFTLKNQHVVKTDNKRFQYIGGLKLYNNILIITTSRLLNYYLGTVGNQTDANYRVMVVHDVKRWLQNTPCASGFANSGSSQNNRYNY